MILALTIVAFVCAFIPALMFVLNLKLYVAPPDIVGRPLPAVSILIPARNEAHGIADAVRCAVASTGVEVEVIVMDDASTDGTDRVVSGMAASDARLRLEHAPLLPPGWNGKQHACWALAQVARHPVLCFVDADVRLAPDCVARMTGFLRQGDNSLVSGFPRQMTCSFLEWMLLPLIHFVLLGFLPLGRMRAGTNADFAAGCGQFLLCDRTDYFACGGHSGIRQTMHDGLRLPRLFRAAGLRTDLADLTELATCRMYTSAAQVWSGLAKNATEGIAAPIRIVPITLLFLFGQVLPLGLAVFFFAGAMTDLDNSSSTILFNYGFAAALSVVLCLPAWLPRVLGVRRFRQEWRGALLHPLGIVMLLTIQWYALVRQVLRRPVSWKSRAYVGE